MHDRLVAEPIKLTYEDFCALPDDGKRYEILDGDLYMSPSPVTPHQRLVLKLARVLADHVDAKNLGEVFIAPYDVLLDEHNIVEPDLVYVSRQKAGIVTDKHIKGSPDLLIEILSPSTSKRDLADKRNIYSRCGVDWYWIIDPSKRSVIELKRIESAYGVVVEAKAPETFQPVLFPGLKIPLSALAS